MPVSRRPDLLPFAVGGIISVVIAFQVMLLAVSRERTLDLVGVRAANRVQANAHEVDALFKQMDLLVIDVREHLDPAEVAGLRGYISAERYQLMREMIREHIARIPAIVTLHVVGSDGNYVFSSENKRPTINILDRPYFKKQQAAQGDTAVVSEIIYGRVIKQWTVVCTRRMVTPDGRFAGLILASVSSDYIASLMQSVDRTNWTLSVIDGDLRHLARYPMQKDLLGKPLSEPAFTAWLQEAQRTSPLIHIGLGETSTHIWAAQPITNTSLYVIAGFSQTTALAQWHRDVLLHALVAGLLIASGIALILAQQRRERAAAQTQVLDLRLRRSEQEIQDLVHMVPVGVFRLQCENSGQLQFLYASPRCHEILGGDPGKLMASSDPPPVHPDDLANFMAAIHTAKSQQSEFQWAGRMILAGQVHWLQITATPSRSPDGVEQWTGIIQDITRRQEAEEALRRQRDLTQVVFDNAPLGILLAAPDLQTIIFANSAACTILGRAREELVGKDLLAFIHPEDEDRVWQTLIQAVRPGHAPERITHRAITPDGRTIDLEIIATGIADEHGHLINGLILQRDITEERRMEQQLRQSEKMQAIGMLAGGIAHDFNNILACITGFADLARRRRRPDDPTLTNYLDQIAGAADRAKTLVQQILSFSRRDAGQLLPVHLQSHVREVMDLLRASIPSSVEIQVDIDQDVGPVLADTGRIHQLLMNLCTNAVHAMAGHGRLVVALDQRELKRSLAGQLGDIRPGLYACLSINDSGCGMDATTLARIFEPFFTTKGSEGTGLGLAVVWNVISTHGGNIQVDSTPGQGTTFRIYLPVIAKTPVDEVAHGTSDLPHGTERLLVVDDEPVLRALYEDMLSDLGYQVRCCANGIEAMSLLRQNPNGFDLMITDQTMPGMTGSELAKAALALRPDLPIVLCSGYSTDIPDEAAAKTLGVRHYCLKPVNLDMMAKTIRHILEPGGR